MTGNSTKRNNINGQFQTPRVDFMSNLYKVSKKVKLLFQGQFTAKKMSQSLRKQAVNDKIKNLHISRASRLVQSNKLLSDLDVTHDFESIPEVPEVTFSDAQARNLVSSIQQLPKAFHQYGIVKIHLPDSYRPQLNLYKSKRKLFIRQQVLSHLPGGKVRLRF